MQTSGGPFAPATKATTATSVGLVTALAGPPLFVVISDWLFGQFPRIGVQALTTLIAPPMRDNRAQPISD